MASDERAPLRWPDATLGLAAVVAGVAVAGLVAAGTDPLLVLWALTAGLPLVALVSLAIVRLARRRDRPSADTIGTSDDERR